MRLVIALGGNALLKRGEPLDAASQLGNVRRAARALAPVARRHQVIVTHGNGPQVVINAIRLLVEAGVIVICAGGGGVPVVTDASGEQRGAQAVIDKDLCAALLASQLQASGLLMLTDADAVYDGWGAPDATPIRRVTPSALRRRTFPPGSMAPKVEAACRFVEEAGGSERFAAIGALADVDDILRGRRGTRIEAD